MTAAARWPLRRATRAPRYGQSTATLQISRGGELNIHTFSTASATGQRGRFCPAFLALSFPGRRPAEAQFWAKAGARATSPRPLAGCWVRWVLQAPDRDGAGDEADPLGGRRAAAGNRSRRGGRAGGGLAGLVCLAGR